MDTTLLLIRIAVGLGLAAHGAQKAFGWWGGPGIRGTLGFMGMLRFRPARLWASSAIATEIVGGGLLALGLLSPLGNLGVVAAMLVAIFGVHWGKGYFAQQQGLEFPLVGYLVPAVALLFSGPGRFSLDNLFGISLTEPITGIVGLALVVLGTGLAFATRSPGPAPQPAADGAPSQGVAAASS